MRRHRPAARARAAPGVAGAGTPAALVNRPQSCARAPPRPRARGSGRGGCWHGCCRALRHNSVRPVHLPVGRARALPGRPRALAGALRG